MKPILVSGSLAYDKIMNFPGVFSDHILPEKIHTLNVSFVVDTLKEYFGGTAGNIAYTLGMLGETPYVLSAAGNDIATYQKRLTDLGANFDFVKILPDIPTMQVMIMTDRKGNQIASVYPGTMAIASAPHPTSLPADGLAIIAPGNIEDMEHLPDVYKSTGRKYLFDPGQQIPQLSSEVLRRGIDGAYIVVCNDYELSLMLAKTGWTEKEFLNKAEIIITTFGEQGSRIRSKDTDIKIPGVQATQVKDPTGAGDAYRGGLLKGLNAGWPLETAGKFASIMGAYAVESLGAQGHRVTFEEANRRYQATFHETI